MRIAAIMDEFTYNNFAPECKILQLEPENCIQQIKEYQPDLLFVESAWHGKDAKWASKIRYKCSEELINLCKWAKENKVPSIFWCKEDPVHFSAFRRAASLCDYVFTSDVDCIPLYKKKLNHDRVYLLPFACQPKIQNPIRMSNCKNGFCFAGAYYKRFPERMENLESLFDAFISYAPLKIYNRFYQYDWPRYKFPEKYDKFIAPNLDYSDIDIAYKGYEYAINLNTVKQSQTMFARRVFELMASGTMVVSNYSRGLKNFFGELVFMSDNGKEIVKKIDKTTDIEKEYIKVTSLRKTLTQHTYKNRLDYIKKIVLGLDPNEKPKKVICLAQSNTLEDTENIIEMWRSQKYKNKELYIIINSFFKEKLLKKFCHEIINYIDFNEINNIKLSDIIKKENYVAWLDCNDWYGEYYLTDLMLALTYSTFPAYGKEEFYRFKNEKIIKINSGASYKLNCNLHIKRSCLSYEIINKIDLLSDFLRKVENGYTFAGLSVDSLNYCENGAKIKSINEFFNYEKKFDPGLDIEELSNLASLSKQQKSIDPLPNRSFVKNSILLLFPNQKNINDGQAYLDINDDSFYVDIIGGKSNDIIFSNTIDIKKFIIKNYLPLYIEGWHVKGIVICLLDTNRKIIQTIHKQPGINHSIYISDKVKYFQIGIETSKNSYSILHSINFTHIHKEIGKFISKNNYILVTDQYADYNDLYKYAFLHARMKAYKEKGIIVDIFILIPGKIISYREYQGINIISGDYEYLNKIMESKKYKKILVHFLYEKTWKVLEKFKDIEKLVWVHGSEIQPWHRRIFNFLTEEELIKAKQKSEKKEIFWKNFFDKWDDKISLIFVSNYFKNEVQEDYKIQLDEERTKIIYNPIDTNLFRFEKKDISQRYKIISLRTFYSRKYGNDLTVKCILKLAERNDFDKFEFFIAGDGELFENTLKPLRKFKNVIINQRFYNHSEMAELYKNYGICLLPTRWDSQGVSRDEAMACGLVPVTNKVAAIPEFVDETCGILAPEENYEKLAIGIEKLVDDPQLFLRMSENASKNVLKNRSMEHIINKEIELIIE